MTFAETLLAWYDKSARVLPWRGIRNGYHTWVSETMLQQTRVETVLRYYPRFIERFPTLESLAAAPEEDVLKLWEGLGYYRRARNLHKGAQQVAAMGALPRTAAELRKISGIGDYTAGAIASIAFDEPVPAVDGNVTRVVSRVRGIRENVGIPSVRRQIAAEAAALVPADRPGDFNQAMMDLGARICVPGTPNCDQCPVAPLCDACREGDAEDIPLLPRKDPPKVLLYDVCLIFNGDRVLMRQRTEPMLQGLWVFPMMDGHNAASRLPGLVKRHIGLPVEHISPAGEAKHIFTHQIWQMKLHTMDAPSPAPAGWQFFSLEDMQQLTIPTAMKAAVAAVRQRLG